METDLAVSSLRLTMAGSASNEIQWNLLVVVPAKNEETSIRSCLNSIAYAVGEARNLVNSYRVVVVADDCSDATVRIAQSTDQTGFVTVRECVANNVALARAIGVETGRTLLEFPSCDQVWVANTDSDTIVPEDWITKQLAFANQGVTGVAGIIEIHEFPDLASSAKAHFARHYSSKLSPTGPHPHVHGANLGFRLDAYDRAGGWGSRQRAEDRDLWTRLQNKNEPLLAASELRALTSGRGKGRVPGGFADWLSEFVVLCDQVV